MNEINIYFNAEKFESLFFIIIGVVALIIGIYLSVGTKDSFYKGFAIPLLLIALIQITVGLTVYVRSPKDIVKVHKMLKYEPSKIQLEEIPRMKVVMKNFVTYRTIEITLILVGMMLFFMLSKYLFIKGIGLGFTVQASLMLLLDFFAETRGKVYLDFLNNL